MLKDADMDVWLIKWQTLVCEGPTLNVVEVEGHTPYLQHFRIIEWISHQQQKIQIQRQPKMILSYPIQTATVIVTVVSPC
jgi:hypothetical protein